MAAMLFLGWNEAMTLLFNPFYLILVAVLVLFLRRCARPCPPAMDDVPSRQTRAMHSSRGRAGSLWAGPLKPAVKALH